MFIQAAFEQCIIRSGLLKRQNLGHPISQYDAAQGGPCLVQPRNQTHRRVALQPAIEYNKVNLIFHYNALHRCRIAGYGNDNQVGLGAQQ